ncbi:MAG TPA: PQQ-binding-like beta-propeller repeat protein [Ktedonobacteraceae bacterium]|nr:PQQ-binding-like beta-propeller repeat protein [Ktedonobacteraceae bacterium]
MDKHNEQFTPETVDEQIDDLLQSQLPTSPDAHIVQNLHRLYSEDAVTLGRVWQRLGLGEHTSFTQAIHQAETSQGRMTGQSRILPYERKRRMFVEHNGNSPKLQIWRSIAVIAAVLIAAILVGSTLWVFNIVTNSSQGGASAGQSERSQGQQQNHQPVVQTPSGVYVGGSDGIARIDTQTGKQIWKYSYPNTNFPGMLFTRKIVPIGNTIYVSMQSFTQSVKPTLLAIDAQTGKLLWSHEFAHATLVDLAAADGILYAGTNPVSQNIIPPTKKGKSTGQLPAPSTTTSTIYAFNAIDGKQHDSYTVSGGIKTLSAANGTLYVGASNGLQALSLSDGKQIWYTAISGQQVDITTPHIVNDVMYTTISNVSELAGQSTAIVAAFKTSTGEKLWQSDPIQSELFGIAVANNKVFVGTMTDGTPFKGGLRAYDAQSGKQLWNTPLDGAVEWAPSVDNGVVYVSAYAELTKPEEVAALNINDGSIKWHVQVPAGIMTTPTVVNGVVYVSTGNTGAKVAGNASGATIALKATDGSQIWTTASTSSPDALIVVG